MPIKGKQQDFLIGTLRNPRKTESHAYRGRWCVNCLNMWYASLGKLLTHENAIHCHMIIVLHELTHVMGESYHESCISWDNFLNVILEELDGINIYEVFRNG
jgi:hypothetical protein